MLEIGRLPSFCPLKGDVAFKITIRSKSHSDHPKFNSNFKSYITYGETKVILLALLYIVPCLFSISMECNSLTFHIAWVWEKMMCLEYALSKWYEAFWGKSNTKTVWAWPKVDNIISFREGCYKLHCLKGLYQGVLIELINQNEPVYIYIFY
jgi:hypothetical protein